METHLYTVMVIAWRCAGVDSACVFSGRASTNDEGAGWPGPSPEDQEMQHPGENVRGTAHASAVYADQYVCSSSPRRELEDPE